MQNTPEHREHSPFTRSRSVSVSSDVGRAIQGMPPPVEPRPAFIAASAASQIVSVELEQNDLIPVDGDNAAVSAGSLALLNGFLDYLLFNILASAKSTQLSDLRPAIADVLKPRLAKEVVSAADEELSEYMGGDKEDELQDFRGGQKPNGEFDLIRSWKLTRLRCMVYTRLGDLEEEEESEYIALEALDESEGTPRRFSSHAGNITPAAAIFLTSIIEFLGEHALVLAGENAGNRLASARNSSSSGDLNGVNLRVTVEENDMEKLALNPTLGRLWRTWRKRVRMPTLPRTLSRESFSRRGFASGVSTSTFIDESIARDTPHEQLLEEDHPELSDPADVALPMNDNDVNEIEIPGLWADPEEAETEQATVVRMARPRSIELATPNWPSSGTPTKTWPVTPSSNHYRSQSLPVQPSKTVATGVTEDDKVLEQRPVATHENQNDATSTQTHLDPTEPEAAESRAVSKAESLEVLERESQALKNVQQTRTQTDAAQRDEADHVTDSEVVEGQGTYQIPKLSSLPAQRPRRKSNKGISQKEDPTTFVLEEGSVPTSYRDDHPLPTQGIATMPHANSTPMEQKPNYPDDRSRSHLLAQNQSASLGSAPTSHPRQLDVTEEDVADGRARRSLNTNRATSSLYTESIEAPHSVSDDSEGSVYRSRTPSYAASHAPSITGQYRQNIGDNSPGRERAAVQRVHLGSTTSQASTKSRRSESISERRPQTSGSATSTVSSKLKILIGRHPAENDVPLPGRPRRSSDASRSAEDVDEPSLDQLIKSDETIHFTLTPRNMREMELPASPRWNTPRNNLTNDRRGTADLAEFLKNTAPPSEQPLARSPSDRQLPTPRIKNHGPLINGLRAHPPDEIFSAKSTPTSVHSPASPVSLGSNRSRSTMHQAREARTGNESVREFADFIRSTGPQGAPSVGASRPSESSLRTHHRSGSTSVVARPGTAQSSSSRTTAKVVDTQSPPRKNGPRLQARDAAGSGGNKTSDLIDFIREGPPGASTHRIPRTVAPFRNTMDSEELMSMDTASIKNESSVTASLASTRAESTNPGSINSHTSSRVPLLENNNPSDAPPIPPRKRRGPRDPYAIDCSDDDDLDMIEETPKVSKPQRQEESMLDFLNSVPPPSNDKPPEPFILTSNSVPPKSLNGTSVLGRFRRNTSVDKAPVLKKSTTSMRSAKLSSEKSAVPPMPQFSNVSSALGKPRANGQPAFGNPGSTTHLNQGHGPPPRTTAPLARPARQTETSALADFLKNTGPPEPPARVGTPMSEEKKDSSFSKIFRRKKLDY